MAHRLTADERDVGATGTSARPLTRPGLLWSEHLYLLAAAAAMVIAVDPLNWRLEAHPAVRHSAFMIAVIAVMVTIVGRKLRSPLEPASHLAGALRAAWPLFALALMIVGGSLYARLVMGIRSTFLNTGLYMVVTFGAAAMVMQTQNAEAMVRAYGKILLVGATVMGLYLVRNYGVRQVYHEEIFLVIPLAALFFAQPERGFIRWTAFTFFLSMAFFSHKYTSYLIAILTVVYLAFFVALPRLGARSRLSRTTVAYWLLLLAGIVAAAAFYLAVHRPVELPTGNPEYRLHTYALAWRRFLESPLWGTLFATEAVEKFTPFAIGIARNRLPTHSDVLDLLANGGLAAALLWLGGILAVFRVASVKLLRPRFVFDARAPYGHALAMLSLAGIVTYAFNPILLQPAMSYLLWTNLGLLLGLSLRPVDARARC
jgi:hypothetical protein